MTENKKLIINKPNKKDLIGLKRGTVKLVPYDSKWINLFQKEKQCLMESFGNTIISIEHIGSTAIIGMNAKPIIDIEIGVESLAVALAMKKQFESLGYTHRPNVPEILKWEELYVKGIEEKRTHYAHVTVYNGIHWKNDLLFRDYLCKNYTHAKQYARLKIKLAKKYKNDRKTYTENKKEFINKIMKIAKQSLN